MSGELALAQCILAAAVSWAIGFFLKPAFYALLFCLVIFVAAFFVESNQLSYSLSIFQEKINWSLSFVTTTVLHNGFTIFGAMIGFVGGLAVASKLKTRK